MTGLYPAFGSYTILAIAKESEKESISPFLSPFFLNELSCVQAKPIGTCPPEPPAPPGVYTMQEGRDNYCCASGKMGLRNGRCCQEAWIAGAALGWAACPTGGGPVLPQTVGAIKAGRLLGR